MKITSIESAAGPGDRVEIRMTDGSTLLLAREIAIRAALRAGAELDEAGLAALLEDDLRWRAREAALHLLSFRARSRAELAGRLRRKEFPEAVVESCLDDLERSRLLDDGAFAESFVRDRVRGKPKGARRLASELRAKGVESETISSAIRAVMAAEELSEEDLARRAAAGWRPREGEDPRRARRRLHGYLARRGFGSDAIRIVLDETLD